MDHVREIRTIADLDERFRLLCLLYSRLIAEEGVGIRPFISRDLRDFADLTAQQKLESLTHLFQMVEVMDEMKRSGQSLKDTSKFLWRTLTHRGWVPQSDIFHMIEESDVVSIHTPDARKIFQNVNYFDYVSYTVEQIYASTFKGRFKRDAAVAEQLDYHAQEIYGGRITRTLDPGIPEYLCEEINSEEKRKFYSKVKALSPLRLGDQICGIVSVARFRIP